MPPASDGRSCHWGTRRRGWGSHPLSPSAQTMRRTLFFAAMVCVGGPRFALGVKRTPRRPLGVGDASMFLLISDSDRSKLISLFQMRSCQIPPQIIR